MRFQERLGVTFDVSPDTLEAGVPNLILQPLVENAIRHAVAPRPEGGRIAIRSRADLEAGDWRLENPRFSEEAIAENTRLADLVAEIASEIGASPAQVALAWLLSRDIPIAAIPGTRKIERLEENWAAQGIALDRQQLDRLAALINQGVAGERY